MIADSAARERALDTSTSFIVQAPAGSGKTELLIGRYLKLLQTVDSPASVVAITFTRKAAGEMRARVIQALRKANAGVAPEAAHELATYEIARAVLDHDRLLGWNLLRNPAQMRIETIDALCGGITRRMPWLSRFGAMPDVSEKAQDLYREAAQNTLRHVERENESLADLLLHLDNDFAAAERLIMNMLEKRDQWLRHTGVNPDFEAVRADAGRLAANPDSGGIAASPRQFRRRHRVRDHAASRTGPVSRSPAGGSGSMEDNRGSPADW